MEDAFLPLLFVAGSAAVVAIGSALGLRMSALRGAAARAVEWAGFTALLAAANVAAGFVLVLVLRRVTGRFLSIYVNTDLTLLAVSALQAAVLLWWMEAAGD